MNTKAKRWSNFRSRVEYAPASVYLHRNRGWEYVPVHPFGDDVDVLQRLGMLPEECRSADVWWGIEGDATLLSCAAVPGIGDAQFFARPTAHEERWVYLDADFDAAYITRAHVEKAMEIFAAAGFPQGPEFVWRPGEEPVAVSPRT